MTDKEKNALKEAFGFEDPDKKNEFVQEFVKLENYNNKKSLFPFIIKFAAAAAMMTAVIGTAIMMPKDIKQPGNDNLITVTTEEATTAKKANNATASTTIIITTKIKTTLTTTVSSTRTAKATASDKTTAITITQAATTAVTASQSTTTAVRNESERQTTKDNELPTNESNERQEESNSADVQYRDLTVSVDKNYPLREKTITEKQYSNIGSNSPVTSGEPSSDETFQPKDGWKNGINIDISEMYKNSCAVVLANLDEIVYTSIGGKAFTAENITVSQVYKGDIQVNDRITVFFTGGFIPAEEYSQLYGFPPMHNQDEYSVKIQGESGGNQEQGRSYVFFLKENSGSIPNGAYEPTNMGNISAFELQQDFYRSVGDVNLMITISQLESGF